ncbi:unnamed protein product [Microthlaspi erraticum]|uniref:non-specific serine/threonine protein kinase n=1 Tax=Microthlaspi erraticum TaxID=1685480 RepID=A0A6D2KUR5_9BRAS|nr:unnamed protein product [Microthlaspi erraticum]
MGSCCSCCRGSDVQESVHAPVPSSVVPLADLRQQAAERDAQAMATEETREHDVGPTSKPEASSSTSKPPEVLERSQEKNYSTKESRRHFGHDGMSSYKASNMFWSTGSFSDPIPNGFYCVIQEDRLKLFKSIPTLDEIRALGDEGVKADVILVDEDEKLKRLKKLITVTVENLKTAPEFIKKISTLVVVFYNQPPLQTPAKTDDFPKLGKIKPGSCRDRAILFKVLADTVGLESKLVVGFPNDLESCASFDSCKHMSIVVTLNGEEMVVDLMRSTGRLIPMSSQELRMVHYVSASGNDSSQAPYMPNESLSRSEQNIATELLQLSQGKVIGRQRTATSSPEYAYVRTRERFFLNGDIKPVSDDASSPKSDEAAKLETKRIRRIDFSELEVGVSVGIGSTAQVFRGTWNGTDVAFKMFNQENLTENMDDFFNEVSIHRSLRHPNVVLFLGACTKPPQLSLVTEYMGKGSLYHLLHSTDEIKKLSFKEKIKILFDICRGLMCIHRMGIVHRDLKSANCLLSKDWTVKICDFGLSKTMKGTTIKDTVAAGTPQWVAPEVIRNEPFSEKSDIFSFGVVMWELCTLSKPWEGVPKPKVVHAVAFEGARLQLPKGPLGKLIEDCWAEPEQRPSCAEILTRLATCEEEA